MNSRIPEDSVLKRHHVASELGDILARMPRRPSDSVLRRHFDCSVQQALTAAVGSDAAALLLGGGGSTTVASGAPASPAPAPAPTSGSAGAEGPKGGGGFFGWLKRLFGG